MRRDAWSPVVPPFRHELMRFCDLRTSGTPPPCASRGFYAWLRCVSFFQITAHDARHVTARRVWCREVHVKSHASQRIWMSRFSKINPPGFPVPRTAISTIARPNLSARITWLGNSIRNTG